MEAEYTAERRRRRLIVLIGVVLAVVAAAGTYYLVTQQASTPPATQRTIVVAAVDIAANTVIDPSMLGTRQVPSDPALGQVISDPTLAVGSSALVDIPAGYPISPNLYGPPTTGGGIAILGPGETIAPDSPIWRAVSLVVPNDRAVGGMVHQSDHVDLFVTLTPQLFDTSGGAPASFPLTITDPESGGPLTYGYYAASTTKLVWTDLEVLQVDTKDSLYVLKVDEHQAEEIAHIQAIGATFTMGLRPPDDNRSVDSSGYGETTNEMINKYGFPIPDMIEVPLQLPSPSP